MAYSFIGGKFREIDSTSGLPLSGGLLYTYAAGTLTPLATYTDAGGLSANTNPVILDSAGRADVFLGNSAYRMILKTSVGVTVWDEDNITTAQATLLTFITSLASSIGSTLVGFIQAGTGAVLQTLQTVLRENVSPSNFGCVMDGTTDDTANFQKAINCKGSGVPNYINFPAGVTMKIASKVYLPPLVTIDLNGSVITGGGANTIFESGYWSGGSVVTNFGQPNETQIVYKSMVRNGFITNCALAFNLFNFCEGSVLENIRFSSCDSALYAKRSFYGKFSNLIIRTPITAIGSQTVPAFWWDDSVNATLHEKCNAVGYKTGLQFSGVKDNPLIVACGGESCTTALNVLNTTESMRIENFYCEASTTCFNFDSGGNHSNVYIDGSHILTTATAIAGTTILTGMWGRNNSINGNALALGTNFSNGMKVEIQNDTSSNNAVAALPAGYTLGDTITTDYVKAIYDSGTGLVTNKAQVHNGIVPMFFSGSVGIPKVATVPFGTVTVATTTITVDMPGMPFTNFDHYVYALSVTDNGSTVNLSGRVAFATVQADTGFAGKTVTASSNGGKLRLVVSGLTLGQACAGVVRLA